MAYKNFCLNMLNWLNRDEDFILKIIFSDKYTFHLSRKGNKHNCQIGG